MVLVGLEEVMQAMLRAAKAAAENAATAQDTREMDEAAKAAKNFSEAYAILDPTRLEGGDTPEARKEAAPPRPMPRDGDSDGKRRE